MLRYRGRRGRKRGIDLVRCRFDSDEIVKRENPLHEMLAGGGIPANFRRPFDIELEGFISGGLAPTDRRIHMEIRIGVYHRYYC